MSFSGSLLSVSTAGIPVLPLVRGMLSLAALAGLLMFFRPLLTGIVRALILVVRPRRTKHQQGVRRQAMQDMLKASQSNTAS